MKYQAILQLTNWLNIYPISTLYAVFTELDLRVQGYQVFKLSRLAKSTPGSDSQSDLLNFEGGPKASGHKPDSFRT